MSEVWKGWQRSPRLLDSTRHGESELNSWGISSGFHFEDRAIKGLTDGTSRLGGTEWVGQRPPLLPWLSAWIDPEGYPLDFAHLRTSRSLPEDSAFRVATAGGRSCRLTNRTRDWSAYSLRRVPSLDILPPSPPLFRRVGSTGVVLLSSIFMEGQVTWRILNWTCDKTESLLY